MQPSTGGRFEHGFLSGFVSSFGGSALEGIEGYKESALASTTGAAALGGTAEAMGGGKFANGAVTGAFVNLFNHMMHQGDEPETGDPPYEPEVKPEEKGVTNNSGETIKIMPEDPEYDEKKQAQWVDLPDGEIYPGEYDGVSAHGVIIKVSDWSDLHIVVTEEGFWFDSQKMYNNRNLNAVMGVLKFRRPNTTFPVDDPPEGWSIP